MRAAIVLLSLAVLRAATWACDLTEYKTRFELFEEADSVIVAHATAPQNDTVKLEVDAVLKGHPANQVTLALGVGDCDPIFPVGKKVLVFVKDGRPHFHYRGVIILGKMPWLARISAWGVAKDDGERAKVIATALGDSHELRFEAKLLLERRPALAKLVKRR